jgi:hypothetical protein
MPTDPEAAPVPGAAVHRLTLVRRWTPPSAVAVISIAAQLELAAAMSVGRPAVRLDPGLHVLVFPEPHARMLDCRLGKAGPPG